MYSNIDVNISLNCYKLKKDVAFWVQYIISHDIKFIINCYCYLAWLIYWMGGGGQKAGGLWTALIPQVGPRTKPWLGPRGQSPRKLPGFEVFQNKFWSIIAVFETWLSQWITIKNNSVKVLFFKKYPPTPSPSQSGSVLDRSVCSKCTIL